MSSKTQRCDIYALALLCYRIPCIPMDHVREDLELFADFLTTYYTDHELESCFLLNVDREICVDTCSARASHYKLGLAILPRASPLFPDIERSRRFIHWILMSGWREVLAQTPV